MRSDDELISLIRSFPIPASFKEADTGKYIVSNSANSVQLGVSNPDDLIGLTIHDIKFCEPEWGARYANMIARLDFRARDGKTFVMGRHRFLDDNGDAQYEHMTKFPVLGIRRNILGIVTYRQDRTETLPPSELYRLYRDFYKTPEAIRRVLVCLDVEASFIISPTDTQFRVFLAKAERHANKDIARLLGMSPRTVECHLDALRNKVVDGDLRRVFAQIKRGAPCVDR